MDPFHCNINNRMSIIDNARFKNIVRVLCAIVIIAIALVAITVYHAPISGLFLFLIYFIFFINIPGSFVLKLFNLEIKNTSTHLLLCLFMGWAMIVTEYFISVIFHNSIIPYAIGPIFSSIFLFNIYRRKSDGLFFKRVKLSKISVALCIAVALMMFFVFLRTQFIYLSPDCAASTYVSIDKAYQMGIINSLQNGYPVVNPWIAGKVMNYHIFTQILYAVAARLFGLSADFIVMSCGSYLTVYSLGLAYYSLFKVFSKRQDRAGLYTLAIVLSHMFIGKSFCNSYLFRIIFVNDNYGGYGVAAALAWLVLLKLCLDRAKGFSIRISDVVILSVIMMLVTGIKAPVALVLVGGLIGTWLLALILRACHFKSLVPIAFITCSFFAMYKIFLDGTGSSTSSNESLFGFGHLDGICFWKRGLIDFLTQHSVPGTMRLVIILLLFMVCFLTAFLLPFTIGYIRELVLVIRKIKKYDFSRVMIYAVALVGLTLSLTLKYSGHSEIYFSILLTGVVPLISFWFFEDLECGVSDWIYKIGAFCKYVFFIVLIISTVSFVAGNIQQIPSAIKHSHVESHYNKYRSMTADEYEAMQWIKRNTPKNALIATHMHSSVAPHNYSYENRWTNCHFLYAAYSCRNYYHEGSGFSLNSKEWTKRKEMIETNAQLFNPSNTSRGQLAHQIGVSYVVVTKKALDIEDLSNDDYTKCFSNPGIDIYKIS